MQQLRMGLQVWNVQRTQYMQHRQCVDNRSCRTSSPASRCSLTLGILSGLLRGGAVSIRSNKCVSSVLQPNLRPNSAATDQTILQCSSHAHGADVAQFLCTPYSIGHVLVLQQFSLKIISFILPCRKYDLSSSQACNSPSREELAAV
eukprot:3358191-Amphidinium_carterae.1